MTSARDLTMRLADLLRQERAALAEFLVQLADFDRRRLWVELGHASLFYFLHRELGLSKGAAFYRKTAAELVQRFPEVIEPLRDGRLCLTSVVELAKVLTTENRAEVLPRFFHVSKQEAKAVSAALKPDEAAPRREMVTRVVPAASAIVLATAAQEREPSTAAAPVASLVASPRPAEARALAVHPDEPRSCQLAVTDGSTAAASPRPEPTAFTVQPLTAELWRLHVTVSPRFLEKIEAARAALSHQRPGASADEILEAGLDLLLEAHEKRKGAAKKPRPDPPPSGSDHVPAHVKRAVWARDGGCCQWKVESGGICGSTHQVELDHVHPRARGGESTVVNLRLLCRFHNQLAARQVYGDEWMDRFTAAREPQQVG